MHHTEQALAVARETGWDLDGYAAERGWSGVGIAPGGVHRDSNALGRSNHEVILADLTERFGEAVDTAEFGHWGVGWIREVTYDARLYGAGDQALPLAVMAWREALENHPVACDEHYSETEHAEMLEYCRSLPSSIERDGLEFELARFLDSDQAAAEFAHIAYDRLNASRPDDVREDDLIGAAVEAGLYVLDLDSTRELIADVERERDDLIARIEDFGRQLVDSGELADAARRAHTTFTS
jgi:hypothetical protein